MHRLQVAATVLIIGVIGVAFGFLGTKLLDENEGDTQAERIGAENKIIKASDFLSEEMEIRSDFGAIYSALIQFTKANERFPKGSILDPESELRQQSHLTPEQVRPPDFLQDRTLKYLPTYHIERADETPKPARPLDGERNVWLQYPGTDYKNPEQLVYILWSDGEIAKRTVGELIVYPRPIKISEVITETHVSMLYVWPEEAGQGIGERVRFADTSKWLTKFMKLSLAEKKKVLDQRKLN